MSLSRKCVCFVLICLCTFVTAQPSNSFTAVELTQEWRPEVGWVVTCSWNLAPNDRLQSVFLHRDNRQFAYFRPAPKFNGPSLRHTYSTLDDDMQLTCEEASARCVLTIEPVQPPKADISITCEVSGEGPMFRVGNKSLVIETVVLPSDAVIEVSKPNEDSNPVLNCSSTGVPSPRIEWTVGDEGTKIASFHNSRTWNVTSKLWYSWSTFMPASDQLPVTCTPKVARGIKLYAGQPAHYNAGSRIKFTGMLQATSIIFVISLSFIS